jgi:hypothetical protein
MVCLLQSSKFEHYSSLIFLFVDFFSVTLSFVLFLKCIVHVSMISYFLDFWLHSPYKHYSHINPPQYQENLSKTL